MTSHATAPLGPVAAGERIEALDVLRGFALIGVFLMNVEFFNRSMVGIEEGMPPGLTGIDWVASWFIAYFVQGKFWMIFSLLFGMGFAVMLGRAERAGRAFLAPYLRRTFALAGFGVAHFLFLWSGDILLSYAVAAAGLLVLLFGRWRLILIALAVLVGLAFVPGFGASARVAGSLAFVGLLALYLRSERRVRLRRARVPLFAFIFSGLGALGVVATIVLWALPDGPQGPRIPVTVISGLLLIIAFLSARYHDPVALRPLRLGVSLYVLPSLVTIAVGAVRYVSPPDPEATPVAAATSPTTPQSERAQRLAKLEERKRHEERVLSTGTYAEAVAMRAEELPERALNDTGFAVVTVGVFLIGVWFVRSGVMADVGAHRRLFRGLAGYALPAGIGLGLLGSLIATSRAPGDPADGFQLARGLAMLGSLPACLGYVGLVVVALQHERTFARVRVLAPAGRMALTNYLAQSLISTSVFYGYGAGQWGLGRAGQVGFVVAVFTLQVLASRWWLARFRYGPLEWLWRAVTYRQLPPMRLSTPG